VRSRYLHLVLLLMLLRSAFPHLKFPSSTAAGGCRLACLVPHIRQLRLRCRVRAKRWGSGGGRPAIAPPLSSAYRRAGGG
jgi:hypothetical protein